MAYHSLNDSKGRVLGFLHGRQAVHPNWGSMHRALVDSNTHFEREDVETSLAASQARHYAQAIYEARQDHHTRHRPPSGNSHSSDSDLSISDTDEDRPRRKPVRKWRPSIHARLDKIAERTWNMGDSRVELLRSLRLHHNLLAPIIREFLPNFRVSMHLLHILGEYAEAQMSLLRRYMEAIHDARTSSRRLYRRILHEIASPYLDAVALAGTCKPWKLYLEPITEALKIKSEPGDRNPWPNNSWH